eukprot:2761619-Alexandrium_andersonii.AAC.1
MYNEGRFRTAPLASGARCPAAAGGNSLPVSGEPGGGTTPERAARHVVPAHRRAAREVATGLGAGRR